MIKFCLQVKLYFLIWDFLIDDCLEKERELIINLFALCQWIFLKMRQNIYNSKTIFHSDI